MRNEGWMFSFYFLQGYTLQQRFLAIGEGVCKKFCPQNLPSALLLRCKVLIVVFDKTKYIFF